MIVRDYYFAAWLIEQGFSYSVLDGKLTVNVSKKEFSRQQKSYEESGFKRHHAIVKSLIASVSKDARQSQLSD